MKKIPTLFVREFADHNVVNIKDELTSPDLEEVLKFGTPTVKWDGACCAIIDGKFYKRYDAKHGKKPPEGAIPCQPEADPITGHWPHWLAVDESKRENQWFIEAIKNTYKELLSSMGSSFYLPDWTYEAIGPHFQGNPHNLKQDILKPHGKDILAFPDTRTFEVIKNYIYHLNTIEGIVFWYKDEPRAKIKRKDFGFEWPIKQEDK